MKVGFVGLGAMGRGMAANLVAAGHLVRVHDRTMARAEPLRELGAAVAETPAEAARGAEVVFSMLSDDAAVESVTFGAAGIGEGLAPGAIHVSSSTISVALSERLAATHAALRQGYVAAPVFGRPDVAAAGQLRVIAAGPGPEVDRVLPLLGALGRGVSRLGEPASSANVVKLAGNFLIATMLEGLGEAFALTRKSGVPPEVFLGVFDAVLAGSPIFAGYAARIAREEYDPAGFRLHLGLKDVRLAIAAGEAAEVPLPLASLLHDHLLMAVAQGKGDLDWSALAQLAAERAGVGGAR